MTLDNSTTPESRSTTGADSAPVKKPARRRVTRQAAAPQAVAGENAAPGETSAPVVEAAPAVRETAPSDEGAAPASRSSRAGRSTRAQGARQKEGGDQTQTASGTEGAAPGLDVLAELSAPAEAAPAKAPRRRRATAAGGAPAAAAVETSTPAAEPTSGAPASTTTGSEPVEAPVAPARRSRSRAKTPPAAVSTPSHEDEVASLDVVASIEALGASSSSSAPVDDAPARPARQRRTRSAGRATGAPTEQVTVQETAPADVPPAPTPVTVDGAATEEPDAPKRPTRTRGSRRATSASQSTAPAGAAPIPSDEPAPEVRASTAPAPAPEAVAPAPTEAAADDAPPVAPRRASTALLFQAPDASAPRTGRRRAQSPAGPPRPVVAPVVDEDDELDDDILTDDVETEVSDETVDPSTDGADAAAADDEDEDDAAEANDAPRRRRRRGGRGRRNRGGSDNQSFDGDEDGSDDEEPSDADRGDGQDASGPDAVDGEQPTGGRSRRRSRSAGTPVAEVSEEDADDATNDDADTEEGDESGSSRRRRRRRRGSRGSETEAPAAAAPRAPARGRTGSDEVTALKGSTRLEAKRQRRREGRDAGRRRSVITEAEFLARRESVDRSMIVRERNGRTQIAVLEDGVLVEHYVSQQSQASMAGNVYLGRVQNVLPSMEAAFVDVGKGRNAVLYAGEVNWDAAGLEGAPRRIEQALKSGDPVLVQVTKDPIGHKGARLTSQVTLAGRYLVYVPGGGMTGISRKLPDTERARLKKILREVVPETAGVIVRTAAEGASEEELRADIARLQLQWEAIQKKAKSASAPALLQGEPDLAIRVVRDIFNDDFRSLTISGQSAWSEISEYVNELAPDLANRVTRWTSEKDVFGEARIDEQLAKGMDRKVWLPSGGSLVIDRTEAMTVVDVNTGKFTGSGGTLEETVTRNNLEAAEEIVRQLRLRDIGGIIVIDFIDMVLESNRDLVLRRLVECLGRDRTKHQVAEVTSLGLVQMTRKRVGQGLVEAFSETCEHCNGRGFIVHDEPIEKYSQAGTPGADTSEHTHDNGGDSKRSRRKRPTGKDGAGETPVVPVLPEAREAVKATLATIAAAAAHAHDHDLDQPAAQDGRGGAAAAPAEDSAHDVARPAPVLDVLAELGAARTTREADDAATDEPTDATFPGSDEPSDAPSGGRDVSDDEPGQAAGEVPSHD